MGVGPTGPDSRRRGRSLATPAVAAALAWLVALSSPAADAVSAEGQAPERPTETLTGLVGRLIELEVEASEEGTRWEEQKAHLATTLSLLEKERRRLDESLASAEKDAGLARTEREVLSRSIGEAEAILGDVDEAIEENGKRLLGSFGRCPGPLRRPMGKGAARVCDALWGRAGSLTTAERLQLVSAFSQDCRRTLSSVHSVKQLVELPGGDRVEADALYLGGAIGYFVAPGDRPAGMIVREKGGWKVVRRDALARSVRRALAVFWKESAPALVELPVPAPDDAAKENGAAP